MTPDAEQPKPATTPPALASSPSNAAPNSSSNAAVPVTPAAIAPPASTTSNSSNAHPLANIPTHQSASKLAQVLSETLQEQDTLRNQLHQYQRRVAKLEQILEASNGPASDRTVPLRALLEAEAKFEASEKARMELESRWKAVRDQWAEAHRYWNLLEARAQDTRSGIDRLFEGDMAHGGPSAQQQALSQLPSQPPSSSLPGTLAALPFSGVRAESSRKRHHFPALPPPPNPAQRRPRDHSVGHGQPPSKRLKSSDGRHSREDRARFPDSVIPTSFPPPNQFPAPPQYPAHVSRRSNPSQYPPDTIVERRPASGASDFPPAPRSRSHSPASSSLSLDEELLDLATDSPRRRAQQQQQVFPPNGAAGGYPPGSGTGGGGASGSRKRPRGAAEDMYGDADAEGERDDDIDAVMDDLEGRRPDHERPGRPQADLDRRPPSDMDRRPSDVDRRASYPYPPNYRGHDFPPSGAPYGPPPLHYGPSDRGARGFDSRNGSFSDTRAFNGERANGGSFSERGAGSFSERGGSFAEPPRSGGSFNDGRGGSFSERFPHPPPGYGSSGGGPPPPPAGSGPYGGPGPTFSVAPPPNTASSGSLFPAQQGSFSAGQQPPFPASSAQQATFLPPTSGPPQSRKQQVRGDASLSGLGGSAGDRTRGENKDGAGGALGASALPAGVLPAGMTQGTGRASHAILNSAGQRTCRQCGQPGRYKDGKCVEKWGPGPEGPGTVCDRCRKKMKRVERRGTGTDNIISVVMPSSSFTHSQTQATQVTAGMLGPNGEVMGSEMGEGGDLDGGRRSPADMRSPGEVRSPADMRSPGIGARSPHDSRSPPDDASIPPRSSPAVGREASAPGSPISPPLRPHSLHSSRQSSSTSPPTTALPEHETQPTQRNDTHVEQRHETQPTQLESQPRGPAAYSSFPGARGRPASGGDVGKSPSRSPSPRRFQPALQPLPHPNNTHNTSSMRTTTNGTPPSAPSSSSTPKPHSTGSDRVSTPVPAGARRPGSGEQRPLSSNSVSTPLGRHSSQQPVPTTKPTPPNGVNGTPPSSNGSSARTVPSAMQVGHGANEASAGSKIETHSHTRWMKTEEVG